MDSRRVVPVRTMPPLWSCDSPADDKSTLQGLLGGGHTCDTEPMPHQNATEINDVLLSGRIYPGRQTDLCVNMISGEL